MFLLFDYNTNVENGGGVVGGRGCLCLFVNRI